MVRRASLASFLLLVSCAGTPVDLTVAVVSDWTPGLDFMVVETEISSAPYSESATAEVRLETLDVTGTEDFLLGFRVADLDEVGGGRRFIRVSLRDARRRIVARRTLDVTLTRSFAATVLLARSCRSVVCPAPAGASELTECQSGECVDPTCSPTTGDPASCPPPCERDVDCEAGPAQCEGVALCRSGGCFCQDPRTDGGLVDGGPVDAGPVDVGPDGPPCPPTETACADGIDDDCDGFADCADTDCLGASCDDGLFCTTDDSCGADRACSVTTPTCPAVCNEGTASCDECADDADCGSPTSTAWTMCAGFAVCGTMGNETRDTTTRVCVGGACQDQTRMESRPCTRTVTNGTMCGATPWEMCCGGSCVDTRNNASSCGSCRVSCSAIGRACAATGTGGYACRGCTTNSECRGELNSRATCWDVGAPPTFCQCQCPTSGTMVCADGGCGANMFCYACPGHNYCAPFGGSC